ncbi:MAG: hypothetical protein FLDDKLPJ_02652 [Phycisphaerae bacterium]|nr:hypothetical protein [Phycisphaerae bacterium]
MDESRLHPHLTFPNDKNSPTRAAQGRLNAPIPLAVSCSLGAPEGRVADRSAAASFAVVHVPVASMHEDDSATSTKDEVGFAREVCGMKSEAAAQAVSDAPNDQLGLGVLAANRGHALAALGGRESIAHKALTFHRASCRTSCPGTRRPPAVRRGAADESAPWR